MKNKLIVTLILATGIIIRVVYLFYSSQSATTNIARLCLNTKSLSIWQYGIIEIIFSSFFILTTYFIGKSLFNKKAGILSMLLVSIGPFNLIKTSAYPIGIYNPLLFLGSLSFLFAIIIRSRTKSLWIFSILGLICGISYWIHPYSLYFLIPCILFILKYLSISKGIIFFSSFLLGCSPRLIQPIHKMGLNDIEELFHFHTPDIISLQLNNMLGTKNILILFYLFCFIYFCWWLNKKAFDHPGVLLLFYTIWSVIIISRTKIPSFLDIHPAVLLFASFPYIIAFSIMEIFKRKKIFAIATLVALQLIDTTTNSAIYRKENIKEQNILNNLVNRLELNNINYVYTTPDLMPVITFLTNRSIDGSFKSPFNPAVVLPTEDGKVFTKNLKYTSRGYKKENLDKYTLFHSFILPIKKRKEISPENWTATSNYNNEGVNLAFDRNVDTRWTTQTEQIPGMYYTLDLGKETLIDKITFYLDKIIEDRPSGLKIEVSTDKINWEKAVYLENNENILFRARPQEYYFKSSMARYIRFEQIGYKELRYWSIIELFVYSPQGDVYQPDYSLDDLKLYLQKKKFGNIYTNYWLSANLENKNTNISGDIVLAKDPAIITGGAVRIDKLLKNYNIFYRKEIIGGFSVYYSLKYKTIEFKPIDKKNLTGISNIQTADVKKAFDNNLLTRWTTDTPQSPGYYFQIQLNEEDYVSGIRLWHKGSPNDAPRKITIKTLDEGSKWQVLEYTEDYSERLYWAEFSIITTNPKEYITYIFKPTKTKAIKLILEGYDPIYYWSIHELDVLTNEKS